MLSHFPVVRFSQITAIALGVLVSCQVLASDANVVFEKSKVVVFSEDNSKSDERKAIITFGDSAVVIQGLDKKYSDRTEISYGKINKMVYERSSHSRVAAAILVSPLALFIKRKHHWFTFHYETEDSTKTAILLRLDKKDEKKFRHWAPIKTGRDMEVIIE